jgi:hypothetical protein
MAKDSNRPLTPRTTLEALKKSIRANLILKYVIIFIFLLIAAVAVSYDYRTGTFSFSFASIKVELVAGLIATILITIMYDVFTRKNEEYVREMERHLLINDLSRKHFITSGVWSLSETDISEVAAELFQDDRFLRAIARNTGVDEQFAENIYHAYLRPMWRSPLLRFYEWKVDLSLCKSSNDSYTCQSHQTFRLLSKLDTFRVVITDKAVIGSRLIDLPSNPESSTTFCNNLILIANYNKDEINRTIETALRMKAKRTVSGVPIEEKVSHRIVQLAEIVSDPDIISQYKQYGDRATIVEFNIEPYDRSDVLVFDYSAICSLSEPFFYVQAECISFVDNIVIDYHQIAERLKKVWATSFIGNIASELSHDEHAKVVTGRINGVVMAGYGISLAWINGNTPPENSPKEAGQSMG